MIAFNNLKFIIRMNLFIRVQIMNFRNRDANNLVKRNTIQIKVVTDDLLKKIKKTYPQKKKVIKTIKKTNKILIEYSATLPQRIEPIRKFNQVVVHEHMVDCIMLLQDENMINYKKVEYFQKRGRDIYSNQPADLI